MRYSTDLARLTTPHFRRADADVKPWVQRRKLDNFLRQRRDQMSQFVGFATRRRNCIIRTDKKCFFF